MTQGIAGHLGTTPGKLREALQERGPGEIAVQTLGRATLAGARVLTSGDRWLVAAGTADMTAVLARGEGALEELQGSFALALWDGESLLLARDRFGERPLSYVESRGELWFGPDAHVLRAAGAPVGALDRGSLSDYLELLCVPAPRSMWSAVRKVPAGHAVRFRDGRSETIRHAPTLIPGVGGGSVDRARVKSALEAAVREAHAEVVVLAASTSWGPLLALAPGLRTVAVAYSAQDASPVPDPIVLQGPAFERAHEATARSPEPAGDASLVTLHAAFQVAGAVRALVPHGGAPVFADAARYRNASRVPHSTRAGRVAAFLQRVAPGKHAGRLSRAARTLSTTGGARVRALAEAFTPEDRRALLHSEARSVEIPGTHPERNLDAALALDLDVLVPERFLPALDLAASRAGAQVVAPFLDRRVAEWVVPVRSKEKVKGEGLLRSMFPGSAQDPHAAPPLRAWLMGPLRTQLDDLVRPPSAKIRTFMDPRGIDLVLSRSLAPDGDPRQAYALLMLERWARTR